MDNESGSAAPRPPSIGPIALARIAARTRDIYRVLPEIARECGDVVDIPAPGMTITLVSHPDHVDHIMTKQVGRYGKHEAANELVAGEPLALPLLVGDEWRKVRRPLNRFFAESALAAASPRMLAAIDERLDGWSKFIAAQDFVDLEHELGGVVMAGMMRALYDHEIDDDDIDEYVSGATRYGEYVVSLAVMYKVPRWVPRPRHRKGEAAKATLMAKLDTMIHARAGTPVTGDGDVLDILRGIDFGECPHLAHRKVRSELSGLIFAGFETTAEALAWTLALLCRNPIALGRAYAEVDALGDAPLEYAHLEQLTFLRACFDEGQRLQGAPANVRTALEDDEIGGYRIPQGSHVLISPYGLQRDPRFWDAPEQFDPDRFLTGKISKNAYIPFNVGPRKCMGSRLANIEGVLVLAALLRRFTFQVRDGWHPKQRIRVSTGLAGGLPVRIGRR